MNMYDWTSGSKINVTLRVFSGNEMDDCDSQNESLSAASVMVDSSTASTAGPDPAERLRFHERTGNLVSFSKFAVSSATIFPKSTPNKNQIGFIFR